MWSLFLRRHKRLIFFIVLVQIERRVLHRLARVFIFPLFLLCLSVCVSILAFLIPV